MKAQTALHSIALDAQKMRAGCAALKWGGAKLRQGSAIEAFYAALRAILDDRWHLMVLDLSF